MTRMSGPFLFQNILMWFHFMSYSDIIIQYNSVNVLLKSYVI